MASSRTLQRRPLLAAFLFGLLLAVLTAPSRGSMGRRRAHLQRHHHQHEVTAAAAAGPHPQEKEEEERPRSDGTMRRLAKLTKRPTPSPTPYPTFKPWTRRPTPVPDPNAPTRKPRRTLEPTAAPEFFEPGTGNVVDTSVAGTSGAASAAAAGSPTTTAPVSSEPRLPPAPTPLPPSVDGEAAELTKAFDWTPVIYASVATGILVVVLITIAVMIRVLRVRTPLSPSITPSDLPPSARSAFSASRYSSQFSIEELEPSRQGLPAATSASALHSPRTGGGLGSGSSIGSPLGGSGGVDASLGASATADLN